MAAKDVAIIGCGVSGLTAIKCCLDAGLNPVCFELQSWLGGIWNYTDEARHNLGSVHNSTITNTSKLITCYSDFPVPKEFPNYLPQRLLQRYLETYARHFDLEKYVQFSTEVVKLEKSSDDTAVGPRWLLSSRKLDVVDSAITTKSFDAVMICTGHLWDQLKPIIPGLNKFKGVRVHSGDYRTFHPFVGKTVVIVGCSHSAGDIGVELSRHADQVYISTNSGCYAMTRLGNRGEPIDFAISRATSFVTSLVKLSPGFLNNKYDFKHFGLQPTGTLGVHKTSMTNDELLLRIITGTIAIKGGIKKVTEDSVILEGGEILNNVDALVFATGFKQNYPLIKDFMEVKDDYYVSLYKHIFLPDENTLAVIGATEVVGPDAPTVEMQARVAAEVFAGRCRLPSRVDMEKEIAERECRLLKIGTTKKLLMRVQYVSYMDELGEMIGVKPNLWLMLKRDPKLALQCFFGTTIPAQYRLQGPNSWKGARKLIMNTREQYFATRSTRKCLQSTKSSSVLLFIFVIFFAVVAMMLL